MTMPYDSSEFLMRRRQPLLPLEYFERKQTHIVDVAIPCFEKALVDGYSVIDGKRIPIGTAGPVDATSAMAEKYSSLLVLRYTAGYPLEGLAGDMDAVVAAWEDYAVALRKFKEDLLWSAFRFTDRIQYNQIIQLVGLAILLRRQDLLARIDGLCSIYKGEDAIYDELLAPFLPDRPSPEGFYHADPYETVIAAIDAEDPAERSRLMKQVVRRWYAANEGLPFHDSHQLTQPPDQGGVTAYYGYWCFELAALVVILDIDDSSFRNEVTYPKDLVDYARAGMKPAPAPVAAPPEPRIAAYAGDPCPQTGNWQAPRLNNRVEHVERGQPMPGPARTATGAVVWYLVDSSRQA